MAESWSLASSHPGQWIGPEPWIRLSSSELHAWQLVWSRATAGAGRISAGTAHVSLPAPATLPSCPANNFWWGVINLRRFRVFFCLQPLILSFLFCCTQSLISRQTHRRCKCTYTLMRAFHQLVPHLNSKGHISVKINLWYPTIVQLGLALQRTLSNVIS